MIRPILCVAGHVLRIFGKQKNDRIGVEGRHGARLAFGQWIAVGNLPARSRGCRSADNEQSPDDRGVGCEFDVS